MQITKATTSHINFRKELDEIQIREQDYLIISNNKNGGEKKVLVRITSLSQDKQNELKGEAKILGEYVEGIYKLTPCRIPVSINAQAEIPPKGLISKIISFKHDIFNPFLSPIFEIIILQIFFYKMAEKRGLIPGKFKFKQKITRDL